MPFNSASWPPIFCECSTNLTGAPAPTASLASRTPSITKAPSRRALRRDPGTVEVEVEAGLAGRRHLHGRRDPGSPGIEQEQADPAFRGGRDQDALGETDRSAKRMFGFPIFYLFGLFAMMIVDRGGVLG